MKKRKWVCGFIPDIEQDCSLHKLVCGGSGVGLKSPVVPGRRLLRVGVRPRVVHHGASSPQSARCM